MKKVYFVLFGLISVISFNCQKELNYVNLPGTQNPISTATTLQGNVLDENGQPAAGVLITTSDRGVITDANGYFRITNASFDKTNGLITAEKDGYFKAYRSFITTTGVNQVMIKLVKKELSGQINSSSGGDATLPNGSKINLPANGVVNSWGVSYLGTVSVYASYIDPSARDISQTIPGSFIANDKSNKKVVLTSYGMVAVELESSNGERLQIAPGSNATLTIPIPLTIQPSAPSSISLWYVNEQTGTWQEEGSAKRDGNNYVGEVKHFSFWNCDFGGSAVTLSMTLQSSKGSPMVYTEVRLTNPDGFQSYGWSDSLGQVASQVPLNENLLMEVLAFPCNEPVHSKNIGSFDRDTDLGIVTVSNSPAISRVHGKLLNCRNAPVTDGYAMIVCNNLVSYAAVNSDGSFATDIVFCPGATVSCQILPVDNKARQQGIVTNINLASSQTNAGNILACGTSTEQYINFTLDGKDYSITSDDSLLGYTFPWSGSFQTMIQAVQNTNYINVELYHDNSAGTFPLAKFAVQNFRDSSIVLRQPSTITFTNNPQTPGDFYEGSLSAKFTDQWVTGPAVHNLSGSFRIRRTQ